jgi:1,4-dihydroxy-2-naphthoate octaprenyltransferase
MDALQARFRDRASEILQNTPTITVAVGHGSTLTIETCYCLGNSDEIHCIVKPHPAIVEAVQDDAYVAFTANQGFPKQMLQGTGRAFFLGSMDRHPQIREQILAKIPDATAFLTTIRNLGVLKILPEQIAITDDANLGLGPRPVYVPEAAQALPERRRRWLQAMGITSWPLVLIPVLIAALLATDAVAEVAWWLWGAVFLVAILVHVGTLLLATYTGFRRRIDRSEALGCSRVLHEGLLPTPQVWWTGVLCLAAGALLSLLVVELRGTLLLVIALIGVVGALLYAGWPIYLSSHMLEDAAVFVGFGPLLILGAYYALSGAFHTRPILVSFPLGCLAQAILHARHLHSFAADGTAKTRTLAVVLGWERARLLFYAVVGLSYVLVALLILTGVLPGWAWLTWLSAPLAGRSVWSVWRATAAQTAGLAGLDRQMAQVYLAFGALLVLSLILSSY